MEGVRNRLATVELRIAGHRHEHTAEAGDAHIGLRSPAALVTQQPADLIKTFRMALVTRPLIIALLSALPLYYASYYFLSSGLPPTRGVVVSVVLLLTPVVVAAFLFASKLCFDVAAPGCPNCSSRLEYLGSVPHTSKMIDVGPSPRLYACSECSQRFAITMTTRLAPTGRVVQWKQPLFGELRTDTAFVLGADGARRAA